MAYYLHKVILEKQEHKTNRLINSSSPYLRQHAYNPVDWLEWGPEAFEKAENEHKLILVSIGYSACHWCHVMAHESFEDEATSEIMNQHFVCIKVDREELPDVDQIYMDACQLVNGSGGWPLNAFALPDKRPIHALTYLPKPQWQKLLLQLSDLWSKNPQSAHEYAEKLSRGIAGMSTPPSASSEHKAADPVQIFEQFESSFDSEYGGHNRAPKFPLPNNQWHLLLQSQLFKNDTALEMASHTLTQMYLGGIWDAVEGGFARYSVDKRWFAPHFEKMLYDNAQLIGVYAYASALSGRLDFSIIAARSIEFCENQLKSVEGLMFSAYDADSEGVEGLYYTYTYQELQEILGDDTVFFCQYFQCNKEGNWEHGRNILYAINTIEKAAHDYDMSTTVFAGIIQNCLDKLKAHRSTRVKPGLDDKCILSWNALYLKGLAQAGRLLNNINYINLAKSLATAIEAHFYQEKVLMRIYSNGVNKIQAYLEDYACLIDAYIELYQTCFDEQYLRKAEQLTQICMYQFYDPEKGFFKFSSGPQLITDKFDSSDDVINSGNSIMAHNLYRLSWYFSKDMWRQTAESMVQTMMPLVERSAPWYSNWADLALIMRAGMQQIIVSAPEADRNKPMPLQYQIQANAILGFAGAIPGDIPLFEYKYYSKDRLLYICMNQTCMAPIPFEY